MDDLVKHPEQQVEKPWLLFLVTMLLFLPMAYFSWPHLEAKHKAHTDSFQILHETLAKRKEELEAVSDALSTLLYENAEFTKDFYGQSASVLLSRYQAIDARYSVEIGNIVDLLFAEVKKQNNPELYLQYAKVLQELGADRYSTHHVQIAKELIGQEELFQKSLAHIDESRDFSELAYNVRLAKQLVEAAKTNGLMQTFHEGESFVQELTQRALVVLERLLMPINSAQFTPDARQQLLEIMSLIPLAPDECEFYKDRFDHSVEGMT